MTDDRQRKTLAKRAFPDILLETWISNFVLQHGSPAFASSVRDVDLRSRPSRTAAESQCCFARHLVPPCAQVCLTAAVKHTFSFSVSGSVSHPSSGKFVRTIRGTSLCRF